MMSLLLEELLTVEDLTRILKVNRRTIYRLLEKKELAFAIKIQGNWRFKASDVDAWLEAKKLVPNT